MQADAELGAVLHELRGLVQRNLETATTAETLSDLWQRALATAPNGVFSEYPHQVRDLTAFVANQSRGLCDETELDMGRFDVIMKTIARTASREPCLVLHTSVTMGLFRAMATVTYLATQATTEAASVEDVITDHLAVAGILFLPCGHQLSLSPAFARAPTARDVTVNLLRNMSVLARDTMPEPTEDVQSLCDCCQQLSMHFVQFCRACDRSICKGCRHLPGIAVCADCGATSHRLLHQWRRGMQHSRAASPLPPPPPVYTSLPLDKKALEACGPVMMSLSCMHMAEGAPKPYPTLHTMAQLAHQSLRQVTETCFVCHKPAVLQCSRCKCIKYCGVACQRQAWRSEHRTECTASRGSRFVAVVRLIHAVDSPDIELKEAMGMECYAECIVFRPHTSVRQALAVLGMDIDQKVFFVSLDNVEQAHPGANQCHQDGRLYNAVKPSRIVCVGYTTLGGSTPFYTPHLMGNATFTQ